VTEEGKNLHLRKRNRRAQPDNTGGEEFGEREVGQLRRAGEREKNLMLLRKPLEGR